MDAIVVYLEERSAKCLDSDDKINEERRRNGTLLCEEINKTTHVDVIELVAW